jgi:hypothetical protein
MKRNKWSTFGERRFLHSATTSLLKVYSYLLGRQALFAAQANLPYHNSLNRRFIRQPDSSLANGALSAERALVGWASDNEPRINYLLITVFITCLLFFSFQRQTGLPKGKSANVQAASFHWGRRFVLIGAASAIEDRLRRHAPVSPARAPAKEAPLAIVAARDASSRPHATVEVGIVGGLVTSGDADVAEAQQRRRKPTKIPLSAFLSVDCVQAASDHSSSSNPSASDAASAAIYSDDADQRDDASSAAAARDKFRCRRRRRRPRCRRKQAANA